MNAFTAMSGIFSSRRFNLIAFALIAVMILIAYSNTFTASFHFDDDAAIAENPSIKRMTAENVLKLLRTNRPVVNLSLMLNYSLNGINVVGWHIFNTIFHIANSYFVYLLLLWTLKLPSLQDRYSQKATRMALFGALLFAVHPIQTESVTYIISRTELLATFFYLASFLSFILGAKHNQYRYYVIALITSLLAMGSKEWAVTLPAVIFLYDVLFLSAGKVRPALARWKAYLLIALPWIMIALTVNLWMPGGGAGVGFYLTSAKGINAYTYFLTSLNVLWTYIRLLFLPINQNLDYDYSVAATLFEFPTLLSFVGHLAVIGAAVWLYTRKGWLLAPFGIAWFYIALSPTQSFVPIVDVIFEHRVYLPSIGFFIFFIDVYERIFDGLARKKEPVTAPERTANKARM